MTLPPQVQLAGEGGRAVRVDGKESSEREKDSKRIEPVFLFDLDGTLVGSLYQHVLAWKQALDAEGIALSVWHIHRGIGMGGACSSTNLKHRIRIRYIMEYFNPQSDQAVR
jgi:hypothetical protein